MDTHGKTRRGSDHGGRLRMNPQKALSLVQLPAFSIQASASGFFADDWLLTAVGFQLQKGCRGAGCELTADI